MLTPPLRVGESILIGGMYANDAFVLCGDRLCGGTLDFPAARNASRRPSQTVPFAGPSVDQLRLGVRSRCASISSAHAQCFLLPVKCCYQNLSHSFPDFDLSIWLKFRRGAYFVFITTVSRSSPAMMRQNFSSRVRSFLRSRESSQLIDLIGHGSALRNSAFR